MTLTTVAETATQRDREAVCKILREALRSAEAGEFSAVIVLAKNPKEHTYLNAGISPSDRMLMLSRALHRLHLEWDSQA